MDIPLLVNLEYPHSTERTVQIGREITNWPWPINARSVTGSYLVLLPTAATISGRGEEEYDSTIDNLAAQSI